MKNSMLGGAMAEFIGTFALMFCGGAAILGGQDLLGVAVAHGLALAVMVTAFMHISGGQINPAVSIGLAAVGRQPWGRAIVFIIVQCGGAAVAALLLKQVFAPEQITAGKLGATLGSLSDGTQSNLIWVLALEAVATFLLMMAVVGSAVDPRGTGKTSAVGGFAIGLVVTANILAIGPLTGASMNPARSFGPALVGEYWQIHWAYWAGPVAGAVVAAICWHVFMGGREAK